MTETFEELSRIAGTGGDVVSASGDKIGTIGQVYRDNNTGQPTWVTVKTGVLGTRESFVPLRGASVRGDDLVVGYSRDAVNDSPRVASDGAITPEEEMDLARYYDLSQTADAPPETPGSGAMTRSEERLRVGVSRRATERVRLRKYVVTEEVTQTVQVRREEFRLEREPLGGEPDGRSSDASAGEDSYDIILYAERPVVHTEIVPVERIRVTKERVTEQVTVSEDLRKEQIETTIEDTRAAGR